MFTPVSVSKVVSFRASEELDEFLEQVAQERMTTKSTVAQMLVAERAQQLREEGGSTELEPEEDQTTIDESGLPAVFDRHEEKWYRPDSSKGNKFAVDCADDRRRYFKSTDGAAKRLRKDYE